MIKRPIPALALTGAVLATLALAGAGTAAAMGNEATYRVTVTNLAAGQPLTPPVVVLHNASTSIVEAGQPAGDGIGQLAENGDPTFLLDALAGDKAVSSVAVGDHPIVASDSPVAGDVPTLATIEVTAPRGANRISIASMLICTNDGFSILHDAKLPRKVGRSVTYHSHAYDAGTEVNTEAFEDLVPPCQALTGVSGDAPGTGTSDPDLAEGGVVAPHAGISGGGDLDATLHAVAQRPALIVIERIG